MASEYLYSKNILSLFMLLYKILTCKREGDLCFSVFLWDEEWPYVCATTFEKINENNFILQIFLKILMLRLMRLYR